MFYVNTFWFTKASELVARYDKTNHAEEAMIKLTHLRKSIYPEFHDEDMQGNLPAWIFVPIHDKNHWSLAIIRIHNDECMLGHLDSFQGIHDPEAIFHVLRTLLPLIVPIDPALIMEGIMDVEQQHDGHLCGNHVLQMLASAARKESDGLDRCFREEGLIRYITTLDQGVSIGVYKGRYLRGDVINMYINEAFLKKPREQLHNMFYVNTFWFTKANELVARYDKTNHAEEPMIKITCLQKSICPELHDEDMQGNLRAWIFVPIHGKNHWSQAIIRLHNDVAMLAHLDSSRGTHDPKAIFHIFKTVLCLIMPIDPDLIMTAIMNVEQQHDGHLCGKHILQMLVGAAMKESDGLDRCFREEGLIIYIATLDQVRSFDVMFGMYLFGKMAGPPM
ncbi:hypothetical protein R1flu_015854 [Riccia fluitans]|uniref:Ubiquitin-like protease family profile domain-containing protein n=1 Tax=Riccia fluitans TaxID=41844 RepID=A0ABD1YKC0_9MARC